MAQRWCTKEDVLKDLEVMSGRRVADVDEGYLLYGEQPPPPRVIDDEDDEIELQFGRAASQGLGQGDETGPDLIGITNMLRMVQKYEDSSDEELPVTPNKNIVITKANVYKPPNAGKTRSLKYRESHISPTKKIVTGKANNQPSPEKNTLSNGKNSNKRICGNTITSNSDISSSEASPANTTGDSSSGIISTNNALTSKVSANIITADSIMNSKLNPYVNEFVPKSLQMASSESFKTTENCNGIPVNSIHDMKTGVSISKTLENEIDNSKIAKDVTIKEAGSSENKIVNSKITNDVTVKKADSSKEIKKQMAMMLKNQISTRNDTFQDQQQSNRAIVHLLKLYADPKPEKPLKLLTPQFFKECKATDFKDNMEKTNKTNRPIEQMTSLHDEIKDNVDVTLSNEQGLAVESKKAVSEALGRSENSSITASASLYSEKDERENDNALARNDLMENNSTFNEDNNNASYVKIMTGESGIKESQKNLVMHRENKNIEEFNEVESTQLTPDMEVMNIDRSVHETEIDPYMEESISKVNNWLHDKPVVTVPEKSKSPMLYLGAVGYKRKDSVTCKSPSEVTEKKMPKVTEYKPSSYAEELLKKYTERSKTTTPAPVLNIWEKLEADLKKKDLEVKNRKKKN